MVENKDQEKKKKAVQMSNETIESQIDEFESSYYAKLIQLSDIKHDLDSLETKKSYLLVRKKVVQKEIKRNQDNIKALKKQLNKA